MFNWLNNLQNKPEGQRRKTALVISVSFTIIVVIVWLSVLLAGFDNRNKSNISVDEVSNPIESLKSSLGATINSIKDLF